MQPSHSPRLPRHLNYQYQHREPGRAETQEGALREIVQDHRDQERKSDALETVYVNVRDQAPAAGKQEQE